MDQTFIRHLVEEFQTPLKNPVLVFSLILFIILLSPILLRKLNIPGIIGLIISGVVIGPFGLNLLEKNSAIELFSTIGLLYIMFIAGLELDLNEFQKHKHKSLGFGILTFILPMALGFPLCFFLLKYNISSSFLIASMFSTHTLVAYPIVSRFGVSKNRAVAIAVGGTILTDTAVLIILAVIMGAAKGTLNQEFWIRLTTSLAIFSSIIFLVIPRIARWFFTKLESEKTSHYIFVLSIVFFAAFLAQVAGVEPIIGAFMAGLALNKLIPHSSALMNRIEFIGNAIFIPFFLISVGMLVNVRVIFNGYNALIIAGILTFAAVLGKWLAAFVTQKVYKFTGSERQLIFGLSSAHAAATLAIILVGYKEGLLDENVLNGTIILILITCLIASFVTENAAKKVLLMSDNELNFKDSLSLKSEHILIPIEEFDGLESMLELAIFLKNAKSINPITVLSIVPNNAEAETNLLIAKKKLTKINEIASATETNANFIASIDHNFSSGVIRTSKEMMADTILMQWTNRPSSLLDMVFGEKTEAILLGTDKNVFIYQAQKSLLANKRMLFFCPPLTEVEQGFNDITVQLIKLAKELSLPVICYCNEKTKLEIKNHIEHLKASKMTFVLFEEWEDFLVLSKEIRNDDILIVSSAKKGAVSYQSFLEQIPLKLEKYFNDHTKIIVYPHRHNLNHKYDEYEDVNGDTLAKSIETLQKLGKGIGNIFKT